jgi:hypothetical protein
MGGGEMSDETIIPIREKKFDEAEFMEFVSNQIDKFKRHAEIIKNPENISLNDLNMALAEYSVVKSSLLFLQATTKIEARKHKEQYEQWVSEKYIMIRGRENPKDLTAAKWLSTKELERMVRVEYAFEYKGLKELADMYEMKEDFLGRILDAWNNHVYVLNQISKNIQTEVSIGNSNLSRTFE